MPLRRKMSKRNRKKPEILVETNLNEQNIDKFIELRLNSTLNDLFDEHEVKNATMQVKWGGRRNLDLQN